MRRRRSKLLLRLTISMDWENDVRTSRARFAPWLGRAGPDFHQAVPPFVALLPEKIPAIGRRATFLQFPLPDFLRPRLSRGRSRLRKLRLRLSRPDTRPRPSIKKRQSRRPVRS